MNILTEIKTNAKLNFNGDSKKLTLLELRGSFSRIISTTSDLLENNEINDIESSIREIHLNALDSYTLLDNMVHLIKRVKKDYLVETSSVDLRIIINRVITFYRQKIINKKIEINLSIGEYSSISFQENVVNLIVRNIILNAITSTHEGGKIEITTKRERNSLNFVVIDHGKGMNPHDISWVLENADLNFNAKRSDENRKRLGLKICKVYLESINGDLIIGSQQAKGSRIEVMFPIHSS